MHPAVSAKYSKALLSQLFVNPTVSTKCSKALLSQLFVNHIVILFCSMYVQFKLLRILENMGVGSQGDEGDAINAGVGVGGEFARETDLKDELNLINLNVVSTVHLAKRVVKDMVERGQGKILFTSSIAALMPGPFEAVYAASKAFVQSFSQGLRNELKDTGVTVTALMPGPTDTNFFHRAGMDNTKVGTDQKDDPAIVAKQGFEALMAGKDHVIAGSLKTKLQGTVSKVLPDTVNAQQHRQLTEPRTTNN